VNQLVAGGVTVVLFDLGRAGKQPARRQPARVCVTEWGMVGGVSLIKG